MGCRVPAWTLAEPGTTYTHPDYVYLNTGRKAWDGTPQLKLVHAHSAIWTPRSPSTRPGVPPPQESLRHTPETP
jgi:hypothetical protein